MSDLNLIVNGEPRSFPGIASAADLLSRLGLDPRAVVVEVNRQIVRRAHLRETPLCDGDAVELVHFVGGG